jgi:hypothetical protein
LRRSIAPRSAPSAPASSESSVDLPAPFGPDERERLAVPDLELDRLERGRLPKLRGRASRGEQRRARAQRLAAAGGSAGGTGATGRVPRPPPPPDRPAFSHDSSVTRSREELPDRPARREQRQGHQRARQTVDLAAREQPKITSSGCSRSALPITFGTTTWPSIWWIARKSSPTQIAETGCTTSA